MLGSDAPLPTSDTFLCVGWSIFDGALEVANFNAKDSPGFLGHDPLAIWYALRLARPLAVFIWHF